jgi:hypothetical protein
MIWARRGISRRSFLLSYSAVIGAVYSLWPYAQSIGRGEPFWVNLYRFVISFVVFLSGFWAAYGLLELWIRFRKRRKQHAAEDETEDDLNTHV